SSPLPSPSIVLTSPAPTELYTLSLHDALPISSPSSTSACCAGERSAHGTPVGMPRRRQNLRSSPRSQPVAWVVHGWERGELRKRSEEHTSELQSLAYLVCRLLLEKKKKKQTNAGLCRSRATAIRSGSRSIPHGAPRSG